MEAANHPIHGQHHLKADVDGFYVPRKQGGRGLRQLEKAYVGEITKLVETVDGKEEPLLQIVRLHQHNSAMSQTAGRLKGELQRGTKQIKYITTKKTNERWGGKRMHGQFPSYLEEKLVDIEQETPLWRKKLISPSGTS